MNRILIVALALLLVPAAQAQTSDDTDCEGLACDAVRLVCSTAGLGDCVEVNDSSAAKDRCGLDGCDAIDSWCYDLDGRPCLGPVYQLDENPCILAASICAWLDSWCYDLDGRTCTSMIARITDSITTSSTSNAAAADFDCMGPVCDQIRDLCYRLTGQYCVDSGSDSSPNAALACMGFVCDTINEVCNGCVAMANADSMDCMGPVCDILRELCNGCVEASTGDDSECVGEPCDTINRLCGGCLPSESTDDNTRIRCDTFVSHAVCDTYSLICYANPVINCPPIRVTETTTAEGQRIDCYDSTHPYCVYYEGIVCRIVPDCIRFLDGDEVTLRD